MKNRTKITVGVLAATLLAAAVYAALIATWEIQTSLRIKRTVSIGVYDTDGLTPLISMNFGDFTWNSRKYFPGEIDEIPTEYFFINNTDQMDFYVGFGIDNPVEGIGIALHVRRGDQAGFTRLSAGDIYPYPMVSQVNDPNPDVQYAHCYISVLVNQPAFGTYNPLLRINAYDTAAG